MKCICLQENLLKGLLISKQAGSKSTTLPILGNFLLKAEKGTISIHSTNLEIGIKTIVRGKVDQEGSITVDQDKIVAYVKNLPQDKVNLELVEQTLNINVRNSFKASFNGIIAEEFPLIPAIQSDQTIILEKSILKTAFQLANVSLPRHDFRPEISGVLFDKKGKDLIIVGTDSFRLSQKKIILTGGDELIFSYIIPSKTVQEIIRIIDLVEDEEVKISFGENQVSFLFSNVEVVSKLVEGSFPQYEGIIPKGWMSKVQINRIELIQAIKLASVFSGQSVRDITCSLSQENNFSVRSSNSEIGNNTSLISATIIAGESNMQSSDVTFNYTYLLDGLALFNSEIITLELNGPDSPAIINDGLDASFLYLVMPIKG